MGRTIKPSKRMVSECFRSPTWQSLCLLEPSFDPYRYPLDFRFSTALMLYCSASPDCQLVEIEGWQDRRNLVRGIKPDEFWESEICSLSPSTNICIWWPHPQDGKVALFARVRDVRLQERKGIANPFYDIGDGARGCAPSQGNSITMAYYGWTCHQCHWGSLGQLGRRDVSDGTCRPFEKCGAIHAFDGWDGRFIFHAAWQRKFALASSQW